MVAGQFRHSRALDTSNILDLLGITASSVTRSGCGPKVSSRTAEPRLQAPCLRSSRASSRATPRLRRRSNLINPAICAPPSALCPTWAMISALRAVRPEPRPHRAFSLPLFEARSRLDGAAKSRPPIRHAARPRRRAQRLFALFVLARQAGLCRVSEALRLCAAVALPSPGSVAVLVGSPGTQPAPPHRDREMRPGSWFPPSSLGIKCRQRAFSRATSSVLAIMAGDSRHQEARACRLDRLKPCASALLRAAGAAASRRYNLGPACGGILPSRRPGTPLLIFVASHPAR